MSDGMPPQPGAPAVGTDGQPAGMVDPSLWIINGWKDLLLLVLTPVVIIPLVVLPLLHTFRTGQVNELILVAVAALLATGHHLPGFLRVYGDRRLFRAYRWRCVLAPVFLLLVCLLFSSQNLESLVIVVLVWGFWHNMRQAYGFARIYDAKVESFARSTIYLDSLLFLSWFGLAIVLSPGRMEQLLRVFYTAGGPSIAPTWISAVRILWVLMTAILSFTFMANYIVRRRRGQEASLVKLLVMASSIGFWWFCMVTIRELVIGILAFEVYHVIQSITIDWISSRRAVDGGGNVARVVKFLVGRSPVHVGLYVLLAIVYGTPIFLATWLGSFFDGSSAPQLVRSAIYTVFAASALVHFYFQGFVWRIRDPGNRHLLGIPEADPESGRAWVIPSGFPPMLGWVVFMVPVGLLGTMELNSDGPDAAMYENLVETVPNHWRPHAELGRRFLDEGRAPLAEEQFRKALELNPDRAELHIQWGQAVLLLGKVDLAVESFERATELRPALALAHRELGKALFGRGDLDLGIEHLREATRLAPDNALGHYELGLAEVKISGLSDPADRDLSTALTSFDTAIRLDESFALAFNARGAVFWNLQKFDEALVDLDKALEIQPDLVKASRNRAGVWMSLADPKKAIEDLSNAIRYDGRQSRDYVLRGDLYYNLRDYGRAAADYEKATQLEEVFLDPVKRYIGLLTTCPDTSFRNFGRAIDLAYAACRRSDWQSVDALRILAVTHAAAKNFDQAIRWQEQAIAIAPDNIRDELQKMAADFRQAKADAERNAEKTTPEADVPDDAAGSPGDQPAGKPTLDQGTDPGKSLPLKSSSTQ